jgi:hypothetical protein
LLEETGSLVTSIDMVQMICSADMMIVPVRNYAVVPEEHRNP